jgi:hypothetical protein
MKQRKKWSLPVHAARYLPLGIALLGIAAIVAIVTPHKTATQTTTNLSDLTKTCQSEQQFTCYSSYFETRTRDAGAKPALADLQQLYEQGDGYVRAQCHQLGHVIGRIGFQKYGSMKAAYEQGGTFCWSGYYHGATEAAVKVMGAERIKQDANTICSDLAKARQYSFDHYNCVHGLGHGFMSIDDFQLFNALKTCDLLTDSWERQSCYGGVFMENVMIEVRGDGKSEYLKPDQPMYPCTAVDEAYKQQCYLMQTSYALQQNGYDFAKVFALCRDVADAGYTATCYQSLGRDASGSTNSELTQTKSHCDLAPDALGLQNCMLGAVRDIVSYYHSDTQAKQFCALFSLDLKQRCEDEVTAYYRSF